MCWKYGESASVEFGKLVALNLSRLVGTHVGTWKDRARLTFRSLYRSRLGLGLAKPKRDMVHAWGENWGHVWDARGWSRLWFKRDKIWNLNVTWSLGLVRQVWCKYGSHAYA
ncbi:hypothetical protein PIB30_112835 [Stylosanthes scabra]|uniref:Uncharacterized protein n=1 Tax=Stylosanthes scabra TaxID=79078 RepID=A0ABU6T0Y2_9FABA|nr:hypothetical protein [Stylosanthes scabra]